VLLADWGVGQVLWSILWFFLFFMWIWLVIAIFADIIRSDDMSGWAKALWSIFIIFLPFLGVFVYLIARGGSMAQRSVKQAQAQEQAFQTYVRETAGSADTASQLDRLATLHNDGKLSDDEFAKAKAKLIG
jgi:hypothetical protein